jgi:hypothetical protein
LSFLVELWLNDAWQNLAGNRPTANPGKKEGAYEVSEQPVGVTGEEVGRRQEPFEVIDAESTSVHPNNPPE